MKERLEFFVFGDENTSEPVERVGLELVQKDESFMIRLVDEDGVWIPAGNIASLRPNKRSGKLEMHLAGGVNREYVERDGDFFGGIQVL